ncbi:Ectopic P Granules Protein 5 [Manis pentadactyla]|nr:Ectopic P Granules Protein 5 [Manis pentadactyla]
MTVLVCERASSGSGGGGCAQCLLPVLQQRLKGLHISHTGIRYGAVSCDCCLELRFYVRNKFWYLSKDRE